MVVCNTTISIDVAIKQEWIGWMKNSYIPLILETGNFIDVKLLKIHSTEDEGGSSYALMMWCKDMNNYTDFEKQYSRQLDGLHNTKFGGRFASFRTLLEEA